MKKLLSIILAVALVLSMGVSAVAVSPTEVSVSATLTAAEFNAAPTSGYTVTGETVCGVSVNVADFSKVIYNALKGDGKADVTSFAIPYSAANQEEITTFINSCYNYAILSYPDLLYGNYFEQSYSLSANGTSGNQTVTSVNFTVKSTYKTVLTEYNTLINKILAEIPSDYSNVEKALFAYNYIIENFEYDATLNIRDPYNLIKKGTGVCQAYTLLYMDLMDRLSIPCVAAFHTEELHPERNHTWNIIKLGNYWYHVDTTWGDPVGTTLINTNYKYFLFSDTLVDANDTYGIHSTYYVNENELFNLPATQKIKCSDNTYESGYLWNDAETGITYCAGKWFTVKGTKLLQYNRDLKTSVSVADLSEYEWKVYDSLTTTTGEYYVGYQGDIFTYGSYVAFSTPTCIKYYDTFSGSTGTLSLKSLTFATEITKCRYAGNGKVLVETNRICTTSGGKATYSSTKIKYDISEAVGSKNLVRIKKYITTGTCDLTNTAFMDIDENGVINIIDLMKLKIKIKENEWFPIIV